MTAFRTFGLTAFRDYQMDGVPSSGPYRPEKSAIHAFINELADAFPNADTVSDGVANDTVALQAALDDFGPAGGTLNVRGKYLVGNLTIPANVRVLGQLSRPDADTANTAVNYEDLGSALYTLPGTTITIGGPGVTFERCLFSPSTIKGAQQADTSNFAGTCFTSTSGQFYGFSLIGCAVLGYAKAGIFDQVSRLHIEDNSFDCLEVLDMTGSFDTTRILDNQCWPFLTIIAYDNTPANAAVLQRGTYGFDLKTGQPDTWIDGNLLLGFQVGMRFYHADNVNLGNNWVDHPPDQNRSGNISYLFDAGCRGVSCETLWAFGCKEAVLFDMGVDGNVHVGALMTEQLDSNAVRHESGHVHIGHHQARTLGGPPVQLNTTAYNFQLDSWQYLNVNTSTSVNDPPINCGVANLQPNVIRIGDGTWDGAVGSVLIGGTHPFTLGTIASASTVALPPTASYSAISGTTTINEFSGGWAGREFDVYFLDVLTLTHDDTKIILPGGIDATTFAGSSARMRHNGTAWMLTFNKRDGTPVYANKAQTWSQDQTFLNAYATRGIFSAGATYGIGYTTGAGGTQSQGTDKSTAVTLNKACGEITLNSATLNAGAIVNFTFNNSAIAAGDLLIMNHVSGGTIGAYGLTADCGASSATIYVRNNTAGNLSDAIVIRFAVIKGVTS